MKPSKSNPRKSSYTSRSGVQLIARIDADLKDRLLRLAKSNDRTLTAELVRAIRQYLERAES